MIEEVVVHEVPIALVMLAGKAYVLVHVEGDDVLKGNFSGLVLLDQALVNTQRGGTGGQTQDEGTVSLVIVDGIGDMLSGPCAHFVVVVSDNQFHAYQTPIVLNSAGRILKPLPLQSNYT